MNANTLTGADRYEVYPSVNEDETPTGFYHVWDHDQADYVANAEGLVHLTETDAHDLAQEWIHS